MDGGTEYDPLDYCALRIHSCGVFVRSGGVLTYAGGIEYVQYIERENLCFSLIKEYIKDFIMIETEVYQRDMEVKIHWLFPGQSLDDGLALLYDDASVKRMDEATTDGGVAEIYAEQIEDDGSVDGQAVESDWEAELEDNHGDNVNDQADQVVDIAVREVYSKHKGTRFPLINVEVIDTDKSMDLLCDGVGSLHVSPVSTCKEKSVVKVTQSPQEIDADMEKFRQIYGYCQDKSKKIKAKRQLHLAEPVVSTTNNVADPSMPGPSTPQGNVEHHKEVSDEDQSDSDFEPVPDCSSGEDSEAETLRKLARELRRQKRAKKLGDGVRPIISNNKVTVPDDDGGDLEKGYETPYFDSDDDCSYDEESDEEGETVLVRRQSQWPRYDSKADNPKFQLSMVFRGKEQMKKALLKYALKEHVHLIFTKDEHDKVRANCSWPGCKWMIYASRTTKNKWMQVSTFVDEHNCIPRRDNRLVTARVIAEKYGNLIKANPTWKLENIQKTVLEDMLVDVHISKCKRAKKMVLEKLVDSTHGEYSKVFDYQLEILRSNPGSTVAVKLDPDQPDGKHVFLRFYVCFKALKKGFLAGCRRVIGLDGCFFKGACYGQLLCALGRDANNQMYPVAWAVVEKETGESWYWFLDLLDKDLKIKDQGEGWVFISDQQKGLVGAVSALVPKAEHRMCARHIYANWKKKHPDHDLQKRFWRCAKAPNRILFNYNRARLAQFTVEGAKDMMKTSPEHWSRAYLKLGSDCDSVDNNMCESFNNCILESRYLPIISMLEWIRCKMMVRIQENRSKCLKWQGTICPNVFKKLKQNIKRSGNCHVLWNGKDGFEVKEHDKFKFTVKLEERACTCRYWQLSGLPCCHAISAIYKSCQPLDAFIAKCYSIEVYNKIYDHCLEPLEGEESWRKANHPRPEAPGYIRMPGRPKTERKREDGEAPKSSKMHKVGTKIRCSLCHKEGHNIKSCKNNPNTVHNVNDHIVRHGTRKRRADKAAYDVEIAKKTKNVAESSQKGKAPAHVVPQVAKEKKSAGPADVAKEKKRDGPAAVAKEKKRDGPAVVAKEKKKSALTITGSQSSRPSAQPRSQPSQQPSHCVFNLAAYKAKMMKNGTEGSSGSAKK